MSNLYATANGDKGLSKVSRQGSKEATATVNGWDSGITVTGRSAVDVGDMFEAEVTGGSNGNPHVTASMIVTHDGVVQFWVNGVQVWSVANR